MRVVFSKKLRRGGKKSRREEARLRGLRGEKGEWLSTCSFTSYIAIKLYTPPQYACRLKLQ